ncbi:MAG: gamma-glutamyltransferase [Chloroflexota bacterium]|nr:MAG: gamma-glutamyltransferase [Chloroflexota bacterium]
MYQGLSRIAGERFASRRSVVHGRRGAVATSQPLAAQAGLRILMAGGNAFDAAIATAAALNVVEPMSTGIGGDAFALCCRPGDPTVYALNASGRAAMAAQLDDYRARFGKMPMLGIHSVSIPGAVDGWASLLARFGTMTLRDVLRPAIEYAEEGYPVSELIARNWASSAAKLRRHADSARHYLFDGEAPRVGQIVRLPALGRSLRQIAEGGRDAFYHGEIAEKIVATSQAEGGCITLDDLRRHVSTWDEPIHVNYRGYELYECPPNGQGLVALVALNVLSGHPIGAMAWSSTEHQHLLIEAIKIGFAEASEYVADPAFVDLPLAEILSAERAAHHRASIDPVRASTAARIMPPAADTVYLTTADGQGNACSFINSLFHGFGSGVTAGDTGICLQNRAGLFSLDPNHRNRLEGGKRPYQTIIPAMVTRDGKPWLSYGVMGGFMQPQGHVQVLSNLVDFDMNPQEALDAPRFRVMHGTKVGVERSMGMPTIETLRRFGHDVIDEPPLTMAYGGGQAILIDPDTGVLSAASEPRKDGLAVAY